MKTKTNRLIPGHDEGARLTPEQAAEIARGWIMSMDAEDISDALLLLRSLCYTEESNDREAIIIAVEQILIAEVVPEVEQVLNHALAGRLARLQEGAAQ